VTFFFTDIEGSTRRWEADPKAMSEALAVHDEVLRVAVGSTLQVYPVAGAVPRAKSAGARVVIINAEPTGFDEIADAVIHQRIGDVLPRVIY